MIGNVVSRRYASALFALGREAGEKEMERYAATLNALGEAVEESRTLADAFRNPVLSVEEKKKVVLALLEKAGGGTMERRFCACGQGASAPAVRHRCGLWRAARQGQRDLSRCADYGD